MCRTILHSALVAACVCSFALGADWASWRGPEQIGLSREKAPVTSWSPDGRNLLWKSADGGRTTPLVMNGRVYFIGPVGEGTCVQERVLCLDADTGKLLWQYKFNVFFTDIPENRVGWTALAGDPETGNLYAHGTGGEMLCFDRDGKVLWRHSMTEEYNRVSGYGGRLITPIVDENRVVVSFLSANWGNHAKPAHRFVAFDKNTGEVVWWSAGIGPPLDTAYACPVVTVIDGRRELVYPAGDGFVYGLEARTGRILWQFHLSKAGCNSSPVVDGNYVYVSHSEENIDNTTMGRLVCIDASLSGDITKTGERWRLDGLDAGYASPALGNGRIYHVDNSANLHCIDARTGKPVWTFKLGRIGKGSPVVTADGVIYVGEQNGAFWIVKDAGDHAEELSRVEFQGPADTVDEIFGSPAICDGRVYFMTRYGSYCLGQRDAEREPAAPVPAMAAEHSADGAKAATLLVFPADATLAPGAQQLFQIRAYSDHGTPVKISGPVEWSVAGVKGAVGPSGEFMAAPDAMFSAGMVTAKAGGLSGAARVRIAPRLPIEEDFEKMPEDAPPAGWSGVVGKTRVTTYDGSKVFEKIAEKGRPSPVWKMRAYIGKPAPAGYTVQVDAAGQMVRRRFKPDFGVINDRYELILMGNARSLELSRWRDEPMHSLKKKLPFEMEPDTWYRLKLSVALAKGIAVVRGKVWPRDQAEPADWTIELTDECPNLEGCPGLFVYSNGTTAKSDGPRVFFDNLMVTRDESTN